MSRTGGAYFSKPTDKEVTFGGVSAGTSAISLSTSLVAQTAKTKAASVEAISPSSISVGD